MSIEEDKLQIEKERFAWERKQGTRGFRFRTYVVPLTSILTTLIVASIGFMSYLAQQDSYRAQREAKETELTLASQRFKFDFMENQRKAMAENQKDFDAYMTTNGKRLSSGSMLSRTAFTTRLLKRYVNSIPNVVIDYFRSQRDEVIERNELSPSDVACEGELEKCSDANSEYAKRAALTNHVRYAVNSTRTIYNMSEVAETTDAVTAIVKGEGFQIVNYSDPDFDFVQATYADTIRAKLYPRYWGEVRYFYEVDEAFAQTLCDRLNEVKDKTKQVNFRKVYAPEADFRSLRRLIVVLP